MYCHFDVLSFCHFGAPEFHLFLKRIYLFNGESALPSEYIDIQQLIAHYLQRWNPDETTELADYGITEGT